MRRKGELVKVLDVEEVKGLYWDKQMSVYDISRVYYCNPSSIRQLLVRNGGIRNKVEAGRIAFAQGKHDDIKSYWFSGEQNKWWRGGRHLSSGYMHVYMPDYPRAQSNGYVREHILVWEQVNGRMLPDGWVVHHLNGVKTDNRPENLVAMPRGGHSRREMAEAYKKRIRELEEVVRRFGGG